MDRTFSYIVLVLLGTLATPSFAYFNSKQSHSMALNETSPDGDEDVADSFSCTTEDCASCSGIKRALSQLRDATDPYTAAQIFLKHYPCLAIRNEAEFIRYVYGKVAYDILCAFIQQVIYISEDGNMGSRLLDEFIEQANKDEQETNCGIIV